MGDREGNNNSLSPDVELDRRKSAVAQLKRLASDPNYKTIKLDGPPLDDGAEDQGDKLGGDAANVLGNMLRRSSRQHADIRNFIEKEYVKSSAAKELVRHIVMLIVLIAGVTLHRSAYQSYLMNQALITSFISEEIDSELQPFPKTFLDVGQPDEYVDWLTSVVGATLDANTFYNDQPMTPEEQQYTMFSTKLVGGVRLRQLRSAPNKGCSVANQFREFTKTCYSYNYAAASRETKPFGPPEDPERYKFLSSKESGSVGIFGYILDYLDGGGYVVDVNLTVRENGSFTESFQQLINDTWFDRQTRAVIMSMVFLNLELDSRVAVLYLIVEIPGNGVFFPSYQLKTFRINLYVTALDYFRMFLEIVFVLFVAYSVYSEIGEMLQNHRTGGKGIKKYFYNGWNLLELLDIVLYLTVIALYIKYLASPARYQFHGTATEYSPDMEQLAAIALIFYNVLCFNVLLTTFRTFKYLKLNHRLYLLWKTLRHAGLDLIGFLFIFLIFIFGFIFMGWLAFGSDLAEFNTFVNSFSTSWNFIIGNAPDYGAMYNSNRILGPLFFVLFTVFIFFILANMFIAILSNSFEVVNSENDSDDKLKDILEEKVAELFDTAKKLFAQITRKEKKRSIIQILDNLAHPEILDQPNLTREDVAKAIGPNATDMEVEDLLQWVRKLESKKTKKKERNSQHGLIADFEDEDEFDGQREVRRSEMRKTPSYYPPGSPPQNDEATKEAIMELQGQLKEIKLLLSPQRSSPNPSSSPHTPRNRDNNNNSPSSGSSLQIPTIRISKG